RFVIVECRSVRPSSALGRRLGWGLVVVVFAGALVFVSAGLASGVGASNKGTGGSQAACNPSPCTQGVPVSRNVTALDSDGGDAKPVRHPYFIDRPNHLTNAPSNLAPLVIHAGCPTGASGCPTPSDSSNWQPQSATQKYVLLYLPAYHAGQFADPVVSPSAVN